MFGTSFSCSVTCWNQLTDTDFLVFASLTDFSVSENAINPSTQPKGQIDKATISVIGQGIDFYFTYRSEMDSYRTETSVKV